MASIYAQSNKGIGIIAGQIVSATNEKPISKATVKLVSNDSIQQLSNAEGNFSFENLPSGYYKLVITCANYAAKTIDSIHVRTERFDFELNQILLQPKTAILDEVTVYSEKPLIEQADGKITYNVGETALAGANTAAQILNDAPLVTTDNEGKIMIKGKEARVLIDDKPVEMTARQLQDFLESMPGSTIEKIEVMHQPPLQYANDRGGVINIVTKKGKVGWTGRVGVFGGTRGELGTNFNANYRDKKWIVNGGIALNYNKYLISSNGLRTNIFADSSNKLLNNSNNANKSVRPNLRINIDRNINKYKTLSLQLLGNNNGQAIDGNQNNNFVNRMDTSWREQNRIQATENNSNTGQANFTYLQKFKLPGKQLQIIQNIGMSKTNSDKSFAQSQFYPTTQTNTNDSAQYFFIQNNGWQASNRINYSSKIIEEKYTWQAGSTFSYQHNNPTQSVWNARDIFTQPEVLLRYQNFNYTQAVVAARLGGRYVFSKKAKHFLQIGISGEQTNFTFDNVETNPQKTKSGFFNILPNYMLQFNLKKDMSISTLYRKTVSRPGITELNPVVDFTDPNNLRSGNPFLLPYTVHNFDLNFSRTKQKLQTNFSLGYNRLNNLYANIRTLKIDGKTLSAWQNISGRKEFEASIWNSINLSKKWRGQLSYNIIFQEYDASDKKLLKYIDGYSYNSNLQIHYTKNTSFSSSLSASYNRFASPQGRTTNNLSMNLGIQKRILKNKLIININAIDPFRNQRILSFVSTTNFESQYVQNTNTRNFRLQLAYSLGKVQKKKAPIKVVKKSKLLFNKQ